MTWCGSFSFWGWPSVLNGDILTIDPQNPSKVHPSGSVRHRWPKSSRRIACWRSMYRPSSWGDFGFLRLWWLDHFNSNPWLNTIWTIASSSSDKSQVVTDKPKKHDDDDDDDPLFLHALELLRTVSRVTIQLYMSGNGWREQLDMPYFGKTSMAPCFSHNDTQPIFSMTWKTISKKNDSVSLKKLGPKKIWRHPPKLSVWLWCYIHPLKS